MALLCWNCQAPVVCVGPPSARQETARLRVRMGNEVPLESEIPLVREIISCDEERLDALSTQISHLEAALADLVQSRHETRERLREHQAILHPVRRVPPELICEIFALTLDSPDGSTINNAGYSPPWYLGHICRSWRRWAVAYPHLWNHITIPSSPMPSSDPSALEALLLRSINVPLTIYWTNGPNNDRIEPQLVDMTVAHCRRWNCLRLDIWGGGAHDVLDWLRPIKGSLPSLTKLEVDGRNAIPDFFSVAPNLRQVVLTDWQLSYSSPEIQLPWDQITHYRGTYEEDLQLAILRKASNLVQCTISFESPFLDPIPPPSPVVLAHLQRLSIEKPQFLCHLEAPSLKELYCRYMHPSDIPAVLPFVRRSGCLLQKLVLTACYLSSDLIAALRGLPSLGYFLIQPQASAEEQTDLFRELEIAGTSQDLCPNLHSLVYGVWADFPLEPFCTMVWSRLRPRQKGSYLTYLRIFDPFLNNDIVVATRELR
ncbi:hypothetical protein DFH06DRAFT_1482833 [Mycena polygramma]|nr:hypothetical protein DFH06DRAFT_1482833 [Mycena polygramma]